MFLLLLCLTGQPLYRQALLISQALHFGGYGGMPLTVLWATLDVLTIVVIGSGLYLWLCGGESGRPPPPHSPDEPRSRRDAWLVRSLAPVIRAFAAPILLAAATIAGLQAALLCGTVGQYVAWGRWEPLS